MAEHFRESFSFNAGDLGRNLATLDERIDRFIKTDLKVAASRGEAVMKSAHPWKNRTGDAEAGLWADADSHGHGQYQLYMGHGVEYGIYLEKSNGGKFQIVMPTLVETARAFMESLEEMLHQLDNPAPVVDVVAPGVGFDRGTSQGAVEHGQHVRGAAEKAYHHARKVKLYFRDAKGRFTSTKNTVKTAVTKRTRRR
jgi:hypothetical protein